FYCKYKKISLFAFGDMVLPFLLLGQALGRFGNFTNGEAHGVPTFIPPSIIFSLKNRFYDFWNVVLTTLDVENTYRGFHKLYQMIKDKGQLKVFFEGKAYILKEYVPWGVKFPEKYMSPAYRQFDSLPLHPTFFYEMILNFICAGILIYLWRDNKNIGKGTIVGLYLIFYAIIRGFVTFFRADDLMIGYFRAPHVASFIMLIIGFLILFTRRKNLQ
ncbi:MAG: prolipoprotein diacylglyceryl transferase, partial [Deferribacterota bacterium]|nr:prolipoprotein diacylglyceryl transferase [Deferribacterota bacterium]